MNWERIALLLEIVHKSFGVVEANNIRTEALKALKALDAEAAPKAATLTAVDPELPLVSTERRL
jgi:hypothetical protein